MLAQLGTNPRHAQERPGPQARITGSEQRLECVERAGQVAALELERLAVGKRLRDRAATFPAARGVGNVGEAGSRQGLEPLLVGQDQHRIVPEPRCLLRELACGGRGGESRERLEPR